MEFQPNMLVQELCLVRKEVTEKWTNLVPSFTIASFAILCLLHNIQGNHWTYSISTILWPLSFDANGITIIDKQFTS
jgi:hypothetical protein